MSTTSELCLVGEERVPAAGEALARAFSADPLCVYTQPDREARIRQFSWLFSRLVREAARQQSVYAAVRGDRVDGVAVWMPPEPPEFRSESGSVSATAGFEQRFGGEVSERFTTTYRHFEDVHQRCMPGSHWYLALLGVVLGCRGQGVGRALLSAGLERADADDLPCYLETFVPDNVPFYERCGFRVADAGVEPSSEIPFWAMKREPRTVRA